MANKKTNTEVDINEIAITLEVDSDVIDNIRKGNITHLASEIRDDNQNLVLENIEGNLVLDVEEMPDTFHGCYYYNDGVFPYVIRKTLYFIVLTDGKDSCLTRIIDVDVTPGARFRFQGEGKPSVEDPNGDNCIWEIDFEIVPVPERPRVYLMRWNPSISSFTKNDYKECMANLQNGMFRLNWSIHEWEEARRGDFFYMFLTGGKSAGIVFNGQFISDPYPDEDWAGTEKRRMYVDMICTNPIELNKKPHVSLEKLKDAIPSINWTRGYSGALLSEDAAAKLEELFEED